MKFKEPKVIMTIWVNVKLIPYVKKLSEEYGCEIELPIIELTPRTQLRINFYEVTPSEYRKFCKLIEVIKQPFF